MLKQYFPEEDNKGKLDKLDKQNKDCEDGHQGNKDKDDNVDKQDKQGNDDKDDKDDKEKDGGSNRMWMIVGLKVYHQFTTPIIYLYLFF